MPKPTHTVTGPASALGRALGRKTETVSAYGNRDVANRVKAAQRAGVKVQVKTTKTGR